MRPMAALDPQIREIFKELDFRLSELEARVSRTTIDAVTPGFGGVRYGTAATRGNAIDHHPEMFIQVDRSANIVKLFWSTPTNTAATAFDWAEIGSITLT